MRPHVSPQLHQDPPQQDSPSSPSTSKRPHSPSHDAASASPEHNGEEVKRRRLSRDQARGKRMFAGLMGTLNSFQKQTSQMARKVEKRAEIDARVKERVAREKEEIDKDKERQDKERKDREEQLRLDIHTETTRIQNANLLAQARHLHTEATPRIYYRPYLLTSEQSAVIEEQITQTQASIDANSSGSTLRRQNSFEDVDKSAETKDVDETVDESNKDTEATFRFPSPKDDGVDEEEEPRR